MVNLISLPNNALYKTVVELNLQPRFETITNQRNKTSGVKFLLSPKKDVTTEVFGPEGRTYDEIDAQYKALSRPRIVRIITQDDTSKRAKKDKPTFGCSIYFFQNNSATIESDANWYKGHITHQKKGDILFWTHAHDNTTPLIRCEVSYENKKAEEKTKQFFLTPYHINDAFLQDTDLVDAHKEDLEQAQMDAHNRYVALIKAYPTNIANDPRYGKSATPATPSTPASLQSTPAPPPTPSTNHDLTTKQNIDFLLQLQLRDALLQRYFTNENKEFEEGGKTYTRKMHKHEDVLEESLEELDKLPDKKALQQYFQVKGHVETLQSMEVNVKDILNQYGRSYFVAHMEERKKKEEQERERKRKEEMQRNISLVPSNKRAVTISKRAVSEMLKSNEKKQKEVLNKLIKEKEQKSKDITEEANPELRELHKERWLALDKEITSIKVRLRERFDDQSKKQKLTDDKNDDDVTYDEDENSKHQDDENSKNQYDEDSKNQDDADDCEVIEGEVVEGDVVDEVADAIGDNVPIPRILDDENISNIPDPKLCTGCGVRKKGEGLGKGNHSLCKNCKDRKDSS